MDNSSSRTAALLYHGEDDNHADAIAKSITAPMIRVLPPLFLAIGLGAWAAAAYLYTNTQQLVASGEHARGVVVALSRSGSTYSPVVVFKAAGGTEIEFVAKVGTSSQRVIKREQIDVLCGLEKQTSVLYMKTVVPRRTTTLPHS